MTRHINVISDFENLRIVVDSGQGSGSGVVPYLPLNELSRPTPRPPQTGQQQQQQGGRQ